MSALAVSTSTVNPDNPAEIEGLPKLRKTLRQHYRTKRKHYGVDYPNFYDRDLRLLFSDAPTHGSNPKASRRRFSRYRR